MLAAPAHVKLRIAGGETVYEGDLQPGPQDAPLGGTHPRREYAAILEATGPFGTRAQTARFVVDTTKPTLRLLSKAARRFWVSEQVTITGTIGGVRVQATVGPGKFRLGGAPGRIAITAGTQPETARPTVSGSRRPSRRTHARGGRARRRAGRHAARCSRSRAAGDVAGWVGRCGSSSADCETLIPIPSTTRPSRASARMPATLRPSTSTSFGHFTSGSTPASSASACATARPATSESSGRFAVGTSGPQDDRGEQARAGRRHPLAAEPSASRGLLVGRRDRALGGVLGEQPLGRLAPFDEDVLAPESPAEPREDGVGAERIGHAP